eukprot:g10372.t1
MYQKLGDVNADKCMSCPTQQPVVLSRQSSLEFPLGVDGPRLTEVWCSVWVASALVLWQTLLQGPNKRFDCLVEWWASVLFSASSAFLCVFLTFIPRRKLGNLGSLLSNNTVSSDLACNITPCSYAIHFIISCPSISTTHYFQQYFTCSYLHPRSLQHNALLLCCSLYHFVPIHQYHSLLPTGRRTATSRQYFHVTVPARAGSHSHIVNLVEQAEAKAYPAFQSQEARSAEGAVPAESTDFFKCRGAAWRLLESKFPRIVTERSVSV